MPAEPVARGRPAMTNDTITRDFTATTFIVRDGRTLLLWHKKMQAWLPPGGHLHPNELPELAAVREVAEETGLEVEILGRRQKWGQVQVLRRPTCILLEDISEGHQHIDLIYFAGVIGGAKETVNALEAAGSRWCDWDDLGSVEIPEDIRRLGRQAIRQVMEDQQARRRP